MNTQRKHPFLSVILLICSLAFATCAQAASTATLNQEADALYLVLIKKLYEDNKFPVEYKFVDITGDKVHEALIAYQTAQNGGSATFRLNTYKNDGIVEILRENVYGLDKCIYYRDSTSLILHGGGHGNEWYLYFCQNQLGQYQKIAMKGRQSRAYGAETTGAWKYYQGENHSETISARKFKKLVAPLKTGKKRTVTKFKQYK